MGESLLSCFLIYAIVMFLLGVSAFLSILWEDKGWRDVARDFRKHVLGCVVDCHCPNTDSRMHITRERLTQWILSRVAGDAAALIIFFLTGLLFAELYPLIGVQESIQRYKGKKIKSFF